MDTATTQELARRMYQVYAQHADWKDYRGEPLPNFDEMKPHIRSHWEHVAEDIFIYGTSAGANQRRIADSQRPPG